MAKWCSRSGSKKTSIDRSGRNVNLVALATLVGVLVCLRLRILVRVHAVRAINKDTLGWVNLHVGWGWGVAFFDVGLASKGIDSSVIVDILLLATVATRSDRLRDTNWHCASVTVVGDDLAVAGVGRSPHSGKRKENCDDGGNKTVDLRAPWKVVGESGEDD